MFKQFGGGGHGSGLSDNAELHQHQKLEKLYISTRAAKVPFFLPFENLKFCAKLSVRTHAFILIFSITKEILFVGLKVILSPGPNKLK